MLSEYKEQIDRNKKLVELHKDLSVHLELKEWSFELGNTFAKFLESMEITSKTLTKYAQMKKK